MKLSDADAFGWASRAPGIEPPYTLLCFSHLRWKFVFQRPQHLMSRFAHAHRVIYWEEPLREVGAVAPRLERDLCPATGVLVVTPILPADTEPGREDAILKSLLDALLAGQPRQFVRWYYTPMMLPFTRHVPAQAVVYDCMDELANFKFAPESLVALEAELLAEADIVFTGGFSLYEAKKDRHANIHPFPSAVDVEHFGRSRHSLPEPADQAGIPGPRLGFFGVIDERMDLDLIAEVADARPDCSLVLVGPVVKIDPASLPRRPNIHYLGGKAYADLPAYLAGWDAALMPFAINEATRFISPTKTPEYLAGGRPVVSTPIVDVVRHYGALEGVFIAEGGTAFVEACAEALTLRHDSPGWLTDVDLRLANLSWDITQGRMADLIAKRFTTATAGPSAGARRSYDYLVVGAGFAGAILAERLASEGKARVLVIDKRPHVAGNAYDRLDEAGVLVHQYGPHIFHTNSDEVLSYLSRFTRWTPYEHRVLANVGQQLVPIPINRTTINRLYGLDLRSDVETEAWLAARAEPVEEIRTSEDVVVAAVGRELYETFFRGYSRKQWGVDPSALDKSVTARIPTRTGTDDRYFADRHQLMPAEGYTRMFEAILDHPAIDLELGVEWADIREKIDVGHVIFTGPVDEFFDHCYGRLPYRSLRFEHRTLDQPQFQPVAVVNYPAPDVPFTRITEYKHLTGQSHPMTSISYEYPTADGDPYYPMPTEAARQLYKRYEKLADATAGVTFVGRLGTYRYYNMDQVVAQALATFRRLAASPRPRSRQTDDSLALVK